MRVEEDMFFSAIGSFMMAHSVGGFPDVWIDKPKYYVLRGKLAFEALHLRNVTIGEGTVGCNKKENNGFRTGRGQTGNRLAIQVVAVG